MDGHGPWVDGPSLLARVPLIVGGRRGRGVGGGVVGTVRVPRVGPARVQHDPAPSSPSSPPSLSSAVAPLPTRVTANPFGKGRSSCHVRGTRPFRSAEAQLSASIYAKIVEP